MRIATSMIVVICYGLEREGWGFQCLNLVRDVSVFGVAGRLVVFAAFAVLPTVLPSNFASIFH